MIADKTTYSQRVKEEIGRLVPQSKIEAFMELSAMVQAAGSLLIRNKKTLISLASEQEAVILRFIKLADFLYADRLDSFTLKSKTNAGKEIFFTDLPAEISSMLEDQAGIDFLGNAVQAPERILGRLDGLENAGAFIRGSFLAAGSVVDPDKSYHLEIVTERPVDAQLISHAFKSLGINSKESRRRNQYISYIKDSEEISDVLVAMGAGGAMLELENIKAGREFSNQINRRANAETANLDKQYTASLAQIRAIKKIEKGPGLASLPPSLQEIAQARLADPMLNLRQLGESLKPPLGKSGAGHRIKRIMEIAASLEEKDEERRGK